MASQDTEPKVEEITEDNNDAQEEQVPELESQPKEERKMSKNEKKCKKALGKIGLKNQAGITRVTLKRRDGIIFVISNPEVFISPTSENSFVVLGELKMDEPRIDNLPGAANVSAAAAGDATATTETATDASATKEEGKATPASSDKPADADADGDEDLSEEGLTPMNIDMVMQNANCSRAQAVKALRATNNDMVNAIMELSK